MTYDAKLVYVAGPFSQGEVCENIRQACIAGAEVQRIGAVPFIPHAHTFLMAQQVELDYEEWMYLDFVVLERCDALLRLDGPSPGADREVDLAGLIGIPVFYTLDDLDIWLQQQ
jgi:hypothetical protein